MKKISKTLFAASALLAFSGLSAHADSSFSFDVQGEVGEACEAVNNSIDPVETINLNDTTEQTLGSITYRCNNENGFTRTISSANSGVLTNGTEDINYNVSHGGGSGLSFPPEQLTAPKVTNLAGSAAFAAGQTGSFKVQVPTLAAGLPAGTYNDTITVAVAGN